MNNCITKTEFKTIYKMNGFIIESIERFLLSRKHNNGYKQQAPEIKQLSDAIKNNRQLKNIAAVKIINKNLLTAENSGYFFIVYLSTNSYSIFRRNPYGMIYYDDFFNVLRRQRYVLKERIFSGEIKKIYVQERDESVKLTGAGDINTIYIKNGTAYYRLEKSIIF